MTSTVINSYQASCGGGGFLPLLNRDRFGAYAFSHHGTKEDHEEELMKILSSLTISQKRAMIASTKKKTPMQCSSRPTERRKLHAG